MDTTLVSRASLMTIGLVLGAGVLAWAETTPKVTLPQTAEEYAAAAADYEQKANAYRQEAEYHRAMLEAAYKAEIHSKAPIRRAYEQMRKHCQPLIRDAERLAKDVEAFASFHRVRAAELR